MSYGAFQFTDEWGRPWRRGGGLRGTAVRAAQLRTVQALGGGTAAGRAQSLQRRIGGARRGTYLGRDERP
jgi:hypothetical protein